MGPFRSIRRGAVLAALLALTGGAVAGATSSPKTDDDDEPSPRVFFATTDQNQLVRFNADSPGVIRDVRGISGLPSGVSLKGIDFRPLTGDLYGVGSDSVVYRVNPRTGIAIGEGPAFTPALRGNGFGVDFNPTVDKIRVVSDQRQNLRLNVDEGTVLSADKDLNPGTPAIVGAGYTNSSFSAVKPTATTLYTIDAAADTINVQAPPNDGTQTMPKSLGINVKLHTGFDIAGQGNVGYLATRTNAARGAGLYQVDVTTGRTRLLGRIGGGKRLVVTGLAAWQDS